MVETASLAYHACNELQLHPHGQLAREHCWPRAATHAKTTSKQNNLAKFGFWRFVWCSSLRVSTFVRDLVVTILWESVCEWAHVSQCFSLSTQTHMQLGNSCSCACMCDLHAYRFMQCHLDCLVCHWFQGTRTGQPWTSPSACWTSPSRKWQYPQLRRSSRKPRSWPWKNAPRNEGPFSCVVKFAFIQFYVC